MFDLQIPLKVQCLVDFQDMKSQEGDEFLMLHFVSRSKHQSTGKRPDWIPERLKDVDPFVITSMAPDKSINMNAVQPTLQQRTIGSYECVEKEEEEWLSLMWDRPSSPEV